MPVADGEAAEPSGRRSCLNHRRKQVAVRATFSTPFLSSKGHSEKLSLGWREAGAPGGPFASPTPNPFPPHPSRGRTPSRRALDGLPCA